MESPAHLHPSSDTRTCTACGMAVHRVEVHKNRYGQYICKKCRSDGVRAVGRKKMRHFLSRAPVLAAAMLIGVALLVLVIGALVVGGELPAYPSGGMLNGIKEMLKSLNQMAHQP